ncbi:extracellular solute-binding protein [Labrys monachus]|uniref:Iron(III) transport system substrate-binding protein n=1 Tax=Labrys monachus TaxID=217067 RepID=A0ABU0FG76_9HYPH|nr:extracellular solute-binding protein [Labrys monachus]MDQ0393531.1 iron(III) transport system substrate-binding protein [Labrys monachus]
MKLTTLFLPAIAALAIALPSAASSADRSLVVYTPSKGYLDLIVPAFEAETGIKVDMVAAGSGEILQRIKAEAAAPLGDALVGMSNELLDDAKDNLEVPDGAGKPWPPFSRAVVGVFAVNENALGNLPVPASWEDLAKPIYRGKIAYAGADKSGSAYEQLTLLLGVKGEEAGWKLFGRILPNLIVTNSSGAVVTGTGRGEYAIGITNEDAAYKLIVDGAPVKVIYPAEGVVVKNDGSALIKGGKHADEARLFFAYAARPAVQQVIVDRMFRRSPVPGVTLPKGLAAELPQAKIDPAAAATLDRDAVIRKYLALIRS